MNEIIRWTIIVCFWLVWTLFVFVTGHAMGARKRKYGR